MKKPRRVQATLHAAMLPRMDHIIGELKRWPAEARCYDPNSYSIGYEALRLLFKKLALDNVHDIRAGAYAVYGWMPTILDVWPTDDTLLALGATAQKAKTWAFDEARSNFASALKAEPSVFTCINNSVVGTSKFFHFAAPNIFPIWDSVVASNFGISDHHQMRKVAHYQAYFDAFHGFLETGGERRRTVETLALPNVSLVRTFEYLLYLYGKEQIRLGKQKGTDDSA